MGFAVKEKLQIPTKSIGEFVEGMTTLIAQAVSFAFAPATVSVTSPKSVSRGRTM